MTFHACFESRLHPDWLDSNIVEVQKNVSKNEEEKKKIVAF